MFAPPGATVGIKVALPNHVPARTLVVPNEQSGCDMNKSLSAPPNTNTACVTGPSLSSSFASVKQSQGPSPSSSFASRRLSQAVYESMLETIASGSERAADLCSESSALTHIVSSIYERTPEHQSLRQLNGKFGAELRVMRRQVRWRRLLHAGLCAAICWLAGVALHIELLEVAELRYRSLALLTEVVLAILVTLDVALESWTLKLCFGMHERWARRSPLSSRAVSLLATYAPVPRAFVILVLCFGLSISAALHRDAAPGAGDADVSAMLWILVLLGSIAAVNRLPFGIFAVLSQLVCGQHWILSLALSSHDSMTWRFGVGALQLHAISWQFVAVSYRNQTETTLELLARLIQAAQGQSDEHDEKRASHVKNGLEVLIEDMRGEAKGVTRLLLQYRKLLPSNELSHSILAVLYALVSRASYTTLQMQAQSVYFRSIKAGSTKRRSSAPGNLAAWTSGIQDFIEQSFMPNHAPEANVVGFDEGDGESSDDNCSRGSNQESEQAKSGTTKSRLDSLSENEECEFRGPCIVQQEDDDNTERDDVKSSDITAGLHDKASHDGFGIGTWSFDALAANDSTGGGVLQLIGTELLGRYCTATSGPVQACFKAMQDHYVPENPYHTHVHAAEVCNSAYYVLSRLGFWGNDGFGDGKRIAVLLAALGHDLGHFARNNHFLMTTRHHLALTYNDRSILENFHCSTLFHILDKPEAGSAGPLLLGAHGGELYPKLRALIIELILATDMKQHLEALSTFRVRMDAADASHRATDIFDAMANGSDQLQALCHVFRAVDIGHSAKPWNIHVVWSERVAREFHLQGDAERELGLPISPLCDRSSFELNESQLGFLQFVCIPTWKEIIRLSSVVRTQKVRRHKELNRDRKDTLAISHGESSGIKSATSATSLLSEESLHRGSAGDIARGRTTSMPSPTSHNSSPVSAMTSAVTTVVTATETGQSDRGDRTVADAMQAYRYIDRLHSDRLHLDLEDYVFGQCEANLETWLRRAKAEKEEQSDEHASTVP